MLNIPYRWGGDSPLIGLDCSGFCMNLLDAMGFTKFSEDFSAQGIFEVFKNNKVETAKEGCFIFYGKSEKEITHIMYALSDKLCIGASGGGSKTTSKEEAERTDARVKIVPINYRNDLVAILDTKYENSDW